MKTNEILQALNLPRAKEYSEYCTKLFNVYTFIKSNKKDIIAASISEKGLTINQLGRLIDITNVNKAFRRNKIDSYERNNEEVKELALTESGCYSKLRLCKDMLWKKRKNKDNSVLEAEIKETEIKVKSIQEQKAELIKQETERLQTVVFSIDEMRQYLNFFKGDKIKIITDKGNYSFYLPINNKFYYLVCGLLNIEFELAECKKEKVKIIDTITFESEILKSLPKAIKFIAKDDLRPVMQNILLAFDNYKLEIVSTDAHRLYYSNKVESSEGKRIEILIGAKAALKISKMELPEIVEMHILPDNQIMIEDEIFDTLNWRFPDYQACIPTYSNYMEFDRKYFIEQVKSVLPYSNKGTNQVLLHLNGDINFSAQDMDFDFESTARMNYKFKNFNDADIAFNGNFLNEALGIFKEDAVKMYSEGESTKAAIFTNDIDNVLIMPLMLNNSR